jgi:hypothetical protein
MVTLSFNVSFKQWASLIGLFIPLSSGYGESHAIAAVYVCYLLPVNFAINILCMLPEKKSNTPRWVFQVQKSLQPVQVNHRCGGIIDKPLGSIWPFSVIQRPKDSLEGIKKTGKLPGPYFCGENRRIVELFGGGVEGV